MKTLLLTSAGIKVKEEILKILPKPPEEIKIAYIITAANGQGGYDEKRDKDVVVLRELGFQISLIELEEKKESELRNLLSGKDVIYVQGGNTFYLLKWVKESGFDQIVKDLTDKGIIYIGVSAGSYIMCPTIEMSGWKHPEYNDNVGLNDLNAINLVPFLLSVHYDPESRELLKEKIKESEYPVRILTDDQAILVQDDKIELVGNGEEIKI